MNEKEADATFNIGRRRLESDGGFYSVSYRIANPNGGHQAGSGAFGDTIPELVKGIARILRGRRDITVVLRSDQGPLGLAGEAHRVWPVPNDQLQEIAEQLRRSRSDLQVTIAISQ